MTLCVDLKSVSTDRLGDMHRVLFSFCSPSDSSPCVPQTRISPLMPMGVTSVPLVSMELHQWKLDQAKIMCENTKWADAWSQQWLLSTDLLPTVETQTKQQSCRGAESSRAEHSYQRPPPEAPPPRPDKCYRQIQEWNLSKKLFIRQEMDQFISLQHMATE